jgi:predicted ATPase
MYIKSVELTNIRSIKTFKMEFTDPKGWNVIIGDNGTGKSSIIRAIALALVGPEEALGLRADWRDWLNQHAQEGRIQLYIDPAKEDKHTGKSAKLKNWLIPNELTFKRSNGSVSLSSNKKTKEDIDPGRYNWGEGGGWFSVAYGPNRRFAGGNQDWTKVFYSQPKLGAHLSAFGEDVALTEATDWLVKLQYQYLENKPTGDIIEDIKRLVNSPDFLPHRAEIESISSEGVIFKDGNGTLINVNQMSDGYRSILSLTFELIRQLVRVYGADATFKHIRINEMFVDLPGVVLIDEIDAHLHPSWQTRIGQWFTKYFPEIQFIVTTHSPLICRAAEKGTIWRLAPPGSDLPSIEVTGIDRERLINGNILDAYGTDMFGEHVSISEESNAKLNEMADLNIKSLMGNISEKEESRLHELKTIFPTENPVR